LTHVRTDKYSSTGMLKRALSFLVIIASTSGAIGVSAQDGSWATANMPICCKTARLMRDMPEVSMARLCCKLNCSEPGSGAITASNSSRTQGITLATAIIPTPTNFSSFAIRNLQAQANHSHDSNPKYIQHLALLI